MEVWHPPRLLHPLNIAATTTIITTMCALLDWPPKCPTCTIHGVSLRATTTTTTLTTTTRLMSLSKSKTSNSAIRVTTPPPLPKVQLPLNFGIWNRPHHKKISYNDNRNNNSNSSKRYHWINNNNNNNHRCNPPRRNRRLHSLHDARNDHKCKKRILVWECPCRHPLMHSQRKNSSMPRGIHKCLFPTWQPPLSPRPLPKTIKIWPGPFKCFQAHPRLQTTTVPPTNPNNNNNNQRNKTPKKSVVLVVLGHRIPVLSLVPALHPRLWRIHHRILLLGSNKPNPPTSDNNNNNNNNSNKIACT